jgi:hypothetical protein
LLRETDFALDTPLNCFPSSDSNFDFFLVAIIDSMVLKV